MVVSRNLPSLEVGTGGMDRDRDKDRDREKEEGGKRDIRKCCAAGGLCCFVCLGSLDACIHAACFLGKMVRWRFFGRLCILSMV